MSDKTEAFAHSLTRENLMRAFAGESQARNRYTIAAGIAHKAGLAVVEGIFLFTAEQEKSHAKQFYRQLHDFGGQTVRVDGTYPVDLYADLLSYLRAAQHNEYQEWQTDYAAFAANPYVNLVLAGMQAGVAAVIFDVVASLARDIFKTGDWLYILLMVLAFAASFYINVVYIILIAAAVGIAQGLILGKKEGKL